MGIYDGPPRVVAYVRVSQEREGMISPELQLAAIEQVCDRFGYLLVATISDLDLSGQFWKRRQVEVAVQMIEDGAADVVMVWKWSRFARNRRDWALAVDRIESAGGRLESATEPVDASTSAGRLARGLLAEFAAFESERAGDMWREAQQRRTRAGLPGTGREHFGYRYRAGQYLPHPVTGDWLFATETGASINPRTDWSHWKQLLEDAGVRDGRLHDARHTAATVLLLLGVNERTMMGVMGWSDPATAQRYAHMVEAIRKDVAERVGGLLWTIENGDQKAK
jgi:DNA invertase Pin-like site-specific DNA recombinase